MNLTKKDIEGLIRNCFNIQLMPISLKINSNGKKYFTASKDASQSYFESRENKYLSPNDFDLDWCLDGNLASGLNDFWKKQNELELVNLAEPLANLSEQILPREKETPTVSPLIYVMF